jgi:hypothetical protein
MNSTKNCVLLVVSAVAVLAGCGGGDSSGPMPDVSRPLAKYAGNYVYCDGHERAQLTIIELNATTISMAIKSDYYQEIGCAGPIVGTASAPLPIQATFLSNGNATVTGWPAVASTSSLSVDRATIQIPAMTRTVTGGGVTTVNGQRCISYTSGRTCIDVSPFPATTVVGGIAFSGTTFLLLTATSAGYATDTAYPR